MPAIITTPQKLVLPAEVQAFAQERGLTPYLPGILEVVGRVFGDAADISVSVHHDPEVADWSWILFEVQVSWSKEQWRTGMKAWYKETAAICPTTLLSEFSLITYRTP